MTCPRCHAAVTPGDRFCADCGARIAAPEPPTVGGRAEAIGPGLAGQTDPGVKHRDNQDAFALSGPPQGGAGAIAVVCDGVSNSQSPELASETASAVALAALIGALDRNEAPETAMRDAIRLAHQNVCALPFDRQATLDPPATTIIAAWAHADGVTVGWLGDSRAYALADSGPRVLTRDHSWLRTALDAGLKEAEALLDPRAHALLHCLGTTDFSRASPCPEPEVVTVAVEAGWLVLCSDGLWNYAEAASDIAMAAGGGRQADAADLCARVVAFARGAGGHDNVTAVAIRCG